MAWSNTEHTDTIILNCPILDFLEKNIATERLVETVEAKYGRNGEIDQYC